MSVYTGHTAIIVSDMEKALEFYRDLLGLKVTVDFGTQSAEFLTHVPGSKQNFCLMAADDGLECLELFEFSNIDQRRLGDKVRHEDYWSSHVAFLFDNIDEVYKRLVDAGIEIDVPLTEAEGYKFAYVYDPDGYMVELVAK